MDKIENNKKLFFDRYEKLFADKKSFDDFKTCVLEESFGNTIRINDLYIKETEVLKILESEGFVLKPIPDIEKGYDVVECPTKAIGGNFAHQSGLFYVQEASSMLPVLALDPKPGELVLDMAAAPGSKTTQIAQYLKEEGVVVANEVDTRRTASLVANCDRLGVYNWILSVARGESLGNQLPEVFDKVLVDAPCSADGAVQKDRSFFGRYMTTGYEKLPRTQFALLESAFKALKVGGTMIYSTCTLAPEENELLVQEFFNKYSDYLEIVNPPKLEKVFTKKFFVKEWNGIVIDKEISENSYRVIPSIHGMEAFYLFAFKKTKSKESIYAQNIKKVKMRAKYETKIPVPIQSFIKKMKIDFDFSDLYSIDRSADTDYYIGPKLHEFYENINIEKVGINVFNHTKDLVKLNTYGTRVLTAKGKMDPVMVYDIHSVEDLDKYMKGQDFKISDIVPTSKHLVITYKKVPIGLGLYLEDKQIIKNQLKRNLCIR